ncbi:MAG TPA: hypothetical protein H9891_04320 [Candidatus Salinicoccus stercoripullorum]|uniref:Sulfotransferase domain-containing protein n=1 Tax=Candidatus Salinicoccus stercoripullorum TaxID=2838756 RepID=A0A9D1QGI9_9STAP|nr:hypothetical protein [Candidatus Salinicoccus stercoripullorum]
MRTIYLHVGYHKTATTFMQGSIFPNLKHVNFIHPDYIMGDLRKLRLGRLTGYQIDLIRDEFDSFENDRPLLISYEGLSGSPFAPKKVKKQREILKDLRRVFPADRYDVHIIVGLREQVDLITSLYVQHIHQGGVMDAGEYVQYCRSNGVLENFHYQNYLEEIEAIFGRDHMYIMIFEAFKKAPAEELQKLLNYMGEPEIPEYEEVKSVRKANKSFGTAQVALGRRMNQLFKTPIHPEGPVAMISLSHRNYLPTRYILQNKLSYGLHHKKYQLPINLQISLKKQYTQSNYELANQYELDLPKEYFME